MTTFYPGEVGEQRAQRARIDRNGGFKFWRCGVENDRNGGQLRTPDNWL